MPDFEDAADALAALEERRRAEVAQLRGRFLVAHELRATAFRPGERVIDLITGGRGNVVHTAFEVVLYKAPG